MICFRRKGLALMKKRRLIFAFIFSTFLAAGLGVVLGEESAGMHQPGNLSPNLHHPYLPRQSLLLAFGQCSLDRDR